MRLLVGRNGYLSTYNTCNISSTLRWQLTALFSYTVTTGAALIIIIVHIGKMLKKASKLVSRKSDVSSRDEAHYGIKYENITDNERTSADVLCGTGTGPNQWPGNISYRSIVEGRRSEYLAASHKAKRPIAKEVVAAVRAVSL